MSGSRHLARQSLSRGAELASRPHLLEQLVDPRALPQLASVLALAAVPIGSLPRG
jgi:hypothetical protein